LDDREATRRSWLPDLLIAARRWREAIQLIESQSLDELESYELFDLAMAYWGETGTLREDLCHRALAAGDGIAVDLDEDKTAFCFLLWGVGKRAQALVQVNEVLRGLKDMFEPRASLFSYWRYREVSPAQFQDDFQLLQRMLKGEAIRPAFLCESRVSNTSTTPKTH
jgi:hypothetical protein